MSMPVSALESPAPSDQQRWRDEEHLRILSIFHFIVGGFAALFLPLLCLHFVLFIIVVANASAFPAGNEQPFPREMMYFLIPFYFTAGLVTAVYAGGNLLTGWFLRRKTHRVFSFVVAGLDCLQIPWGTILGVFTIVVLARPSVRRLYEARESTSELRSAEPPAHA
jgi:hypothetical protein